MSTALRKLALGLINPTLLYLVSCAAPPLWSQSSVAQPAIQTAAPQVQSDAVQVPSFDVISVKKAANPQALGGESTADGYNAHGMSIRWLIMSAYAIPTYNYIVGLPAWTEEPRYDIEAKVVDSDVAALQKVGWKQRNQMLQQILTERFKLKAHMETINQPIYSLVVTKPGRLVEAAPSVPGKPQYGLSYRVRGGVRTTSGTGTMIELARTLGTYVGRVAVDNTGITGRYDITFDWVANDAGDATATDTTAPSIFTAIQEQLGLKLVPTMGPVECLIIDHVEPPSAN